MKLNRNEKYVKWGLTAFLVIVAAGLFWLVFSNLRGFYDLIVEFLNIIAALLYGCLFAYLMNPVMKVTQRIMDKLLAKRNLSDRMAARISKITGICAAVSMRRSVASSPSLSTSSLPSAWSAASRVITPS